MRIKGLIFGLFLVCCVCFNAAAQRGGELEGVRNVEIYPQLAHSRAVTTIAFSPDGGRIITGSYDLTIKLWEVNTGREIRTFTGHPDRAPGSTVGGIHSIEFSPDGRLIVSGGGDWKIKTWDAATGREIRTLTGHTGWVTSVTFSPDGRQIASASSDNTIKLWDVNTGREIRTFTGHLNNPESGRGVNAIAFSPDGRTIISCADDKTLKLWDVSTGREIRTFSGHTDIVTSVAFSPDGRQIVSGGYIWGDDRTIRIWDVTTGRLIRTIYSGAESLSFSPDGRQFVSGANNKATIWETFTGREIRSFTGYSFEKGGGRPLSVKYSPDGKTIAFESTSEGFIELWDVSTSNKIRSFAGNINNFYSVDFSPDGSQIVSRSSSGISKIWDITSGRKIRDFIGFANFNPDGNQIASETEGLIRFRDLISEREIRTIYGVALDAALFSPDRKLIITKSYHFNHIKIWDADTGREIRTLSGHSGGIASIAISPDGRQLISGSEDGTIRLWDVSSGNELIKLISYTDGEWIVVTPDGYFNASPNGDKYLNVRVGNNVYGIDQYRHTFYRPQIVEARLQGRPDPVNQPVIQQAGEPPVVIITSPQNNARVNTDQVEISVLIDSNQPIRNMKVHVNGRLVGGNEMRGGIRGVRSGDLEATGIFLTQPQRMMEFSLNLNLDPGNNLIEIIAYNPHEGRARVEVFREQTTAQQAAMQNTLPNLWILSIGVNSYDSTQLNNLRYAANDAREIERVFKAQEGRVFNRVNSMLIADGEALLPTKENIIDGFDYLKRANPNDVILLYIAGHGLNDENGNFFFMPSDAVITNEGSIRSLNAISFREIQSVLDVPGQKIVFIDACHSAGAGSRMIRMVDNSRLVRDLMIQSQSTVIFTSSRSDQASEERQELGHGVFTYSIIQGMTGAAYPVNGVITMKALERYVKQRVFDLTDGLQQPFTETPDGFTDFIISRPR